jgi:hypothetical protein
MPHYCSPSAAESTYSGGAEPCAAHKQARGDCLLSPTTGETRALIVAAMVHSRRWIADEIERLDPETDYEAIWRLTSTYGLDEFALNLVYAHLFPHFVVPMHGAETVYRGGDGKIVDRATQRVEDTIRHNLIWWSYGPSHERTRASVAKINRLHAHYARQYPGNLSHLDDYVYTLCFSAASLHRFFLKLGLPGYTDKQKIAAHRFWKEMSALFLDEAGDPISGFPEDWEGIIAYLDEFENRPWPAHGVGREMTNAVLDQFAFRFFPRPLHGVGRALVASTYHPTVWRVHQVDVPRPRVRKLLLHTAGLMIRLKKLAPDPTVNYQEMLEAMTEEQRRERRQGITELDRRFSVWFRERHGLPAKAA